MKLDTWIFIGVFVASMVLCATLIALNKDTVPHYIDTKTELLSTSKGKTVNVKPLEEALGSQSEKYIVFLGTSCIDCSIESGIVGTELPVSDIPWVLVFAEKGQRADVEALLAITKKHNKRLKVFFDENQTIFETQAYYCTPLIYLISGDGKIEGVAEGGGLRP